MAWVFSGFAIGARAGGWSSTPIVARSTRATPPTSAEGPRHPAPLDGDCDGFVRSASSKAGAGIPGQEHPDVRSAVLLRNIGRKVAAAVPFCPIVCHRTASLYDRF